MPLRASASVGALSRLPAPRRSQWLVAEGGVGLAIAGVAVRGTLGWCLLAAGLLAAAGGLGWRRDWLRRLGTRRGVPTAGPAEPGGPFGTLGQLVPELYVAEVAGRAARAARAVGVVGDGQGCAAGVEVDVAAGVPVDLGALAELVGRDPAAPVGLQLAVRNQLAGSLAPSPAYVRVADGVPLGCRLIAMIRLEPARDPDVAAIRGGGQSGLHAAAVAAADRLAAGLEAAGHRVHALQPADLRTFLAQDGGTTRAIAVRAWSDADRAAAVRAAATAPAGSSVLSLCADVGAGAGREYAVVSVTADSAGAADHAIEHVRRTAHRVAQPGDPAVPLLAATALGGGPRALEGALVRWAS